MSAMGVLIVHQKKKKEGEKEREKKGSEFRDAKGQIHKYLCGYKY